jgi:hypothetical protein
MSTDQAAPRTGVDQPRPAIEPLVTLDGWRVILNCCRRKVESMKAGGKLPEPDIYIGRLPRWRPETVRRWIDDQARGRAVGR